MGEIQKQSIKGSIYLGLGTLAGFLTNAIVFPRVLQTNQIGLISILLAYTVIFSQIGSLGFNSITTRLFPYFRNADKKHHGFIGLGVLVSLVGFLLATALFFLVKPLLLKNAVESSALLLQYIDYVIPLVFFSIFFILFDNYYKLLYNAVIGIFLQELAKRIFILASIAFYYFKLVDFKDYIFIYILANALPAMIIWLLLLKNKHFSLKTELSFIRKNALGKGMKDVALFGLFANTTNIITLQIDRIMIERSLGLSDTGIYATCFYFGALVFIPARILTKISSSYIADAWKEKDLGKVQEIYQKSSLNLYIIGLLLLIGIWVNIDNVFIFLPENYISGKYVILIIGLAFLLDMLSGSAMMIVSISEKYRYNTYSKVAFVVLLILTNLICIPIWGILGAAIASLISKLLYNLYKYDLLKKFYKLEAYNWSYLIVLAIGLISYFAAYFLPTIEPFYLDLVIRSAICLFLFVVLIYFSKVSDDINGIVRKGLRMIWLRR